MGEIQSLTNPKQWRFVSNNENPADFTTRGMRVLDMAKEKKWWGGPDFLQKGESDWPVNQIAPAKFQKQRKSRKQLKAAHRQAEVTETGQ